MPLAVAVIPSNQDRNLGAIPGYSEAGGCQIIANKIAELFSARMVATRGAACLRVFTPPLESADDAKHTKLAATMRQAKSWLDNWTVNNPQCALHIHTNAGGTPEQGTSHTGYCWGSNLHRERELGQGICERVSRVLDLPVVEYDYSGQGYLFVEQFAPTASVLIEITRHDRRADLERLYASVDAVATAVVEGLLAWAGQPAGQDEAAQLRAENERLRAALGRCRDALQAVGF